MRCEFVSLDTRVNFMKTKYVAKMYHHSTVITYSKSDIGCGSSFDFFHFVPSIFWQ